MALVMFFLVERNSSSFSIILLSISCLTWVSSSWHLSTLFSSCSRAPSASDRAASSSIFSASILLQILSISWMERPPSLIWSMMSLISLLRVLFSLLTSSSCRTDSSWADLTRNSSEEALRVSFWALSRSMPMLSTFCFHSPTILSNCLAFFSMELGLALLHLAQLGVQLLGGGLSLGESGLHLQLGHLQLLGLGHSLLLVPHLHHLGLTVGLSELPDHVLLGADLLVVVVPHAGHLVLGVPVLAQQALPLLGLVVSHGAGLAELVGQGDLQLGQHVGRVLQLLELPQQVAVLSGQLPLVCLHVSQGQVGLLHLLAEVVQAGLEVLDVLLRGSLAPGNLVSGSAGISDLVHDLSLVLLNLGLDLIELLHLLLHLGGGVSVLLLQTDNGGLLLDLGLLQVSSQLAHLGLSLLVQLNLSTCGSAGLTESLSEVLQLPGEVRPLALSLGSALSLSLKLLLHLFNPGLNLLDGLLDLCNQGLLVLQLAHQTCAVLLLALDGVLQLLPGPLQFGHGLLHDPQLALNLPPLLLDVSTAALLLLIRSLELIKSGLQLALDLVEVTDLVLGNLQVLSGLGSVLADVLLLLVELVDHLVLVGDLVIERLDGVISVSLLLLQFLDGNIDVVNVLLDSDNLLLQDLLVLHGVLTSRLFL